MTWAPFWVPSSSQWAESGEIALISSQFFNFSTTATGQGDELQCATKTQDPSWNWSFFRWTRKIARCVSANWRLSTVSLLRSFQRRNPKNPNANNEATWISTRLLCSSLLIIFLTRFTSKAFLRLGGFAKILPPASATCRTKGCSFSSW